MKNFGIGYHLLKSVIKLPYWLYYEKIEHVGIQNIPQNQAVIFAPNHQNAVMDPLALIYAMPRQLVFLARGDVFKNKWIAKILHFFRIMPVYRMRDGKTELAKNQLVFEQAAKYIANGGAFCLFPEAEHNPHRNLKPIKKGIPRVLAQLYTSNPNQDIVIVPVGIYYNNKNSSGAHLRIEFGSSISTIAWAERLANDEHEAMNELASKMEAAIKPLILNIPENNNYQTIEALRLMSLKFLTRKASAKQNSFVLSKTLIEALPQSPEYETILKQVDLIVRQASNANIPLDDLLNVNLRQARKYLLGSILAGLFLWPSYIVNAPGIFFTTWMSRSVLKDPQFLSTIRFVTGAFLMPPYLAGISLIFAFYLVNYQILIAFPLLLMFSWLGFIHRRYSIQTIRIYKQIRGLKDSNFSKLIQELKSNLESIKL